MASFDLPRDPKVQDICKEIFHKSMLAGNELREFQKAVAYDIPWTLNDSQAKWLQTQDEIYLKFQYPFFGAYYALRSTSFYATTPDLPQKLSLAFIAQKTAQKVRSLHQAENEQDRKKRQSGISIQDFDFDKYHEEDGVEEFFRLKVSDHKFLTTELIEFSLELDNDGQSFYLETNRKELND
eukprot:UN04217